jgi:deazaflavin-dependent oxidoreductase (nitroreductase family)
MDERIRRALGRGHLIDITTTGRRTGEPRRIELVFHSLDGRVYLAGRPNPARRRSWLANLEADPRFTFHLKGPVVADLPASARIIDDPAERRAVCARIIETAWHQANLDAMVAASPLVEVTFDRDAA